MAACRACGRRTRCGFARDAAREGGALGDDGKDRPERRTRAARTKPATALAEIDRVIAAGVRFGCVLADAGYGLSAPFRQGLTTRGLAWAVGIPRHQKVYPVGVKLIWPVAGRGRPRKRHIPDVLSTAAEDMLANAKWQNVSWRNGTKGRLKAPVLPPFGCGSPMDTPAYQGQGP